MGSDPNGSPTGVKRRASESPSWPRRPLFLDCPAVRAPDTLLPEVRTEVPGPRSRALAARLAAVESRNVTCLVPQAPICWERAAGANVWDADGNRFIDLGGGFGVANAGHAHPRVVAAVAEQSARLMHAMGDVHPPAVKVALLEALAARFPGGGPARAVLGSSGSDAVESALKTALVATGKPGVIAFSGAYHGLTLGALDATHRAMFRAPFGARLPLRTGFAHFGDARDVLRAARELGTPVGAVLAEPIQGRGGERVPPDGFLSELRALCDREGWLLILDEVYTGFGRTGRWFACEHEGVAPDLLCVGKGLASGMPISACIGRASVMDAWPASQGEALHTQTFLGHPPSCAAALASMAVLADEKLVERAAEDGAAALAFLRPRADRLARVTEVRGRGLMLGIECDSPETALRACRAALARGVILLPSGDDGRVLSVTPPLCIGREALEYALGILLAELA
jgi:4-aminobutyrate aminotransferase-like enzyme